MRKRMFTLVLALIICLGLAIPAQAKSVDPSSLDTSAAKAYADILSNMVTQHGIRSELNYGGIQYAALEDMDANGTPELIIIDCADFQDAFIHVWTMQSGKAVKVVDNEVVACGNVYGLISYARKNGQTKLYYYSMRASWGQAYDGYGLIGADGSITTDSNHMVEGQDGWDSILKEDTTWITDEDALIRGEGMVWSYDEVQAKAVHTLLTNLTAQANKLTQPVAETKPTGSYSPYTINGDYYTIKFDKALVEEKVVELREEWEDYDGWGDGLAYSTYDKHNVTLVRIPQGSNISITYNSLDEEYKHVYVDYITVDGNNRYTLQVVGVAQEIKPGKVGANFEWDLVAKAVMADNYLIEITSEAAPSTSTNTTNFVDVSSTAYYAAPVSWAIGKGITNGTGTNTFSPDNTCTVVELLLKRKKRGINRSRLIPPHLTIQL